MPLIDETGNKYGRLTVLRQSENKAGRKIRWVCQCECGNITEVEGYHLRKGDTVSCGCYQKDKTTKNEIGKRYGKLTVIGKAASRNHRAYWVCQCDCGNIVEVSGTNLRQGQKACSVSCSMTQDKTGEVYGKLTVIQQLPNNMWKCKCECGNYVLVSGKSLLQGHRLSCGCLRSQGEAKLNSILDELNIKYETQKTFENCRFEDTKGLARFDFYLPEYNILIEYDGEQHYVSKDSGWSNEEQLAYTKQHDEYKNLWCKQNNITLIRIPYYDLEKLNEEYVKNLLEVK